VASELRDRGSMNRLIGASVAFSIGVDREATITMIGQVGMGIPQSEVPESGYVVTIADSQIYRISPTPPVLAWTIGEADEAPGS
jgi:hypothetical protein